MFSGITKIVTDLSTKTLESSYFKNTDKENKTRNVRHILDLSAHEKREFLNSFDIIFSDCDGVLWELLELIEGVDEAVRLLRNAGKKLVFVSNNSVRQDIGYLKRFKESGIDVDLEDLVHPLRSIISYLKKIKFNDLIYCIGTTSFKEKLQQEGFKVIDGPNKILEESFTVLGQNIFDNEPVRAVVMDVDFNLTAPKLMRAQLYLKHPDCILIAGATDMMLHVGNGINLIGPGQYVNLLKDATEKIPIALGKPGKDLGDFLMEQYKIKHPKRTLFIGDMLEQDIGFGNKCGFQTLAVLTGGCKKSDFEKHDNDDEIPDYYADSIVDFVKFFKSLH